MSKYAYSRISPRAWPRLLPCLALAVALGGWLGWWWSLPLVLLALYLVVRYRDPYREIPSTPLAVVSPVDATVLATERGRCPYLDREGLCLRLDVDRYGAYSLRSPVEGKVLDLGGAPAEESCCGRMRVETDEGDEVIVVLKGGRWGRRGVVRVPVGERVGQGQRLGSVRGVDEVRVHLHASARLKVEADTHVQAGSDILALLTHE